jgi:RND superfamily putative drug exporter
MGMAERLLRHRAAVIVTWVAVVAIAAFWATRLPAVLQGGVDAIPGSESGRVTATIRRAFGVGTLFQFPIVVVADSLTTDDPAFGDAIDRVSGSLARLPAVRSVESAWSASRLELLGEDGHSALLIVTPRVRTFHQAERLTAIMRGAIAATPLPPGLHVEVTGSTAMLYDLDEHASSDLLGAERIGLPLALAVLLVVFGSPLAAVLPLLLAVAATTVGLAGLYGMSGWRPVGVFAENVTSMIGLGVGVDYALFVLSRFREAMAGGADPHAAAAASVRAAGHSIVLSGATVALGFMALFLVRAPFLHTLALGGIFVVIAAVAAAMTLLPVLLASVGAAVDWPRRARARAGAAGADFWTRWAGTVMRRPWSFLVAGLVLIVVLVAPVFRLRAWNVGPGDLPADAGARRGYELMEGRFPKGWMGPIVMLIEARPGESVLDPERRRALVAIANELHGDARFGLLLGLPQIFARAGGLGPGMGSLAELPEPVRAAARQVVSDDGRVAIAALVAPDEAGDRKTIAALKSLRARRWPEAEAAGLTIQWGGSSAIMVDFDGELFGSLRRVIWTVVATTFVMLALMFRSLVIPLKATVLNVCSVLAAYGFLVLLFQDGIGARAIGLTPPGGLNSFIVLMLFTILFGLSMDYEVFLLSRIRQEYLAGGDSDHAVAVGLARTGGVITSAALIMVSIFVAFGFTRLIATREFGLGLAFAVALDATLIRVVLVPALMKVSGRWNWWWPFDRRGPPRPPA